MNPLISITKKIKFEIRISLLYLFLGLLWIYFSDTFFAQLVSDKHAYEVVQLYKGFFYILITSLLLFYLVKRHMRRINKAQENARESQTKFEAIANQATEGIALIDFTGKVMFVNPAFCTITGYLESELLNAHLPEKAPGLTQLADTTNLENNLGAPLDEVILVRKDLSGFACELNKQVMTIGGKDFLLATLRDVSEKKKMIDDLVEAKERAEQANKLKDAFMANMSHEIRTPLNGIMGMSTLIKDAFEKYISDEEQQYFDSIDRSVQRIIRTFDLILNYSRMHVGEFTVLQKEINLAVICKNSTDEFLSAAACKGIKLSFHNTAGNVFVFADEYYLTQAIYNLVDNAIKYTFAGAVQVTLASVSPDEVMLSIKDTGIGISDVYLTHLFEPYSQEHSGYGRGYEGVGLGLALVKKIVDLNDGSIKVKSKKGEGTEFLLRFKKSTTPVEKKSPGLPVTEPIDSNDAAKTCTVLVVEDDIVNQNTFKWFLEPLYHTVITGSSDKVFELLLTTTIDLVLMDISIAGSMDGLTLTKKIKSEPQYRSIPIIVVTAHAFEQDRRNAFESGCDDYLAKPFSKNSLLQTINRQLRKN